MNLVETLKILLGLEIHITVKSNKKIFNWTNTYSGTSSPNSQVSAWELGYLGVLPLINPEVIYLGIKLATVLKMKISKNILFDRKIYNYFDLPKGYQITQQECPLATDGHLPIIQQGDIQKIPLKSLHLEEDTAKSTYHQSGVKLDFNRAGNPLLELVTEPVFCQIETVVVFIKQLQNLLRYLDISEAKMEQGQLRVDLNFSLQLGKDYSTPRYEIKNLNSLTNLEKALNYEINKHRLFFSQEQSPPPSQTLGFDEGKQITRFQREKTSYFYLPEVNIPPLKYSAREIRKIAQTIPTLPWIQWEKLNKIGVSGQQVNLILEKPLLLRSLTFLEKKRYFTPALITQWISFFLNYLNPFFTPANFSLFLNEWKIYLRIFEQWKLKELENNEVKTIVEQLLTNNKNSEKLLNSLLKKYQKGGKINSLSISHSLEKLWTADLAQKYPTKPHSVRNFLFGQMKKTFSNLDIKKLNQVIIDFIESKIKV